MRWAMLPQLMLIVSGMPAECDAGGRSRTGEPRYSLLIEGLCNNL
jgi:hypothetical protein